MIAGSVIDPENQQEVPPGLTRVTLIGVDGREYDVVARYDGATQQISSPILKSQLSDDSFSILRDEEVTDV